MSFLEVKDLEVCYGLIRAIKGVSFSVEKGETVALIGANGAGKTTIMHALCNLIPKKSGQVIFNGRDITSISSHKLVSMGMVQVPEGSGRGQTEKINRSLSRLNLNAKKRPGPISVELLRMEHELTSTQQVVVLITENQGEALQDAVRKMASKGASFLWLGVFYKKEGWSGPNIHGVDYLKWEVEHEG